MDICTACCDKNLFRPAFGDDLSSWTNWFVVLRAIFGLEMNTEELEVFKQLSGRETAPTERVNEAWLIVGRRSGKSKIVSILGAYLAVVPDYSDVLSPGEPGIVMVLSQNKRQAAIIFNYLRSLYTDVPLLARMVTNITRDTIELVNNIRIEIHASNFKSIRGHTLCAAICDEIGFWQSEDSYNPDFEILSALRPSMATTGGMLIALSSPYRRSGALFQQHQKYFGNDDDVLVIQSDSKTMNPTLSQRVIDAAYQLDPESAQSEYGGRFRNDLAAFVDPAVLQNVIPSGLRRRRFIKGILYHAFCDPSGGSSDSFTLSIGHLENDIPTLDVIEERKPPFSPESVIKEFSELMKQYEIHTVTGDRYGGEFPRELFRKCGINYRVSDLDRSRLYLEFLPLINSGNCSLLDDQTLIKQLLNLERRVSSAGRDSIDHSRNTHDDVGNSTAGVMSLLTKRHDEKIISLINGRELTPTHWEWSRLNGGNTSVGDNLASNDHGFFFR